MLEIIKNQKKMYGMAAVFSATALLLVLGLVFPIINDIKHGAADILIKKDEVAHADVQALQLADFTAKYADYQQNLSALHNIFVDSANPIDFIQFLEAKATESSLDIDIKLASTKEKSATGMPAAIFQVFLGGNFNNILSFVEKIERGQYLLSIQKLSIQKQKEDLQGNTLSSDAIEANIILQVLSQI